MEFSRQEYWDGLPFPSPGYFPTQGSNPGLLHCRQILLSTEPLGKYIYNMRDFMHSGPADTCAQTVPFEDSCPALGRDSGTLAMGRGGVQPPCPGESFLLGNVLPFMRPTVGLFIDLRTLGTYPHCLPASSLLLSHLTCCSQAGLSHSCFEDHLCHYCPGDSWAPPQESVRSRPSKLLLSFQPPCEVAPPQNPQRLCQAYVPHSHSTLT